MENRSCKAALRRVMKQRRDKVSLTRKARAAERTVKTLAQKSAERSLVLSYSSIGSELSLNRLNQRLAAREALVLPYVHGCELKLFLVSDTTKQLKVSSWGIAQPIPDLCQEISPAKLDLAFIPALAFDRTRHRLGYGKGFYDRLLSNCLENLETIGVGFTEQLAGSVLPREPHDLSVGALALF